PTPLGDRPRPRTRANGSNRRDRCPRPLAVRRDGRRYDPGVDRLAGERMADEALRRLEREAAAGDLQAALRYAGALEREGRRGEAACLLRRFPGEKAAQEALAR